MKKPMYEIMIALDPAVMSEDADALMEKVKGQIAEAGGEVKSIEKQGSRRLAYKIRGKQEANFFLAFAKQTQFAKADLTNARMFAINLLEGSLQKARLYNTDLKKANLCMVNIMHVKFKNTYIEKANLAKTFITRWISK